MKKILTLLGLVLIVLILDPSCKKQPIPSHVYGAEKQPYINNTPTVLTTFFLLTEKVASPTVNYYEVWTNYTVSPPSAYNGNGDVYHKLALLKITLRFGTQAPLSFNDFMAKANNQIAANGYAVITLVSGSSADYQYYDIVLP